MAVSEWDQRQLCADGGCIGVIGSDGTCKVCGRPAPNWGDERMRGLIAAPEDEHGDAEDDEEYDDDGYEDDDGDDGADQVAASAGAPAWGGRALCPDGSCIGVIGADGRCKVCSRVAPADPAPAQAVGAAAVAAASVEPTAVAATAVAATAVAATAVAASAAPPQAPAPEAAGAAADDRERCADSACTGLIGTDGRCAVCGKGAS